MTKLRILLKMKKNIFRYLIIISIILFPIKTFALSDNYIDRISEIVGVSKEDNKINLYLFRGEGCPHCADEEKWLKNIRENYKEYLNVYDFEVWYNDDNIQLMRQVANVFNINASSVPFTIIGNRYFLGFSETISTNMENLIRQYAELDSNSNETKIPILGNIDMKNVSIPLVAIILGFIDGFNPCAMWILLFLINMFFRMKDKKKAWFLGLSFLFVSGLVYFLSMLGINLVLDVITISWIKKLLAIFITSCGITNFKKYIYSKKEEVGCIVVNDKKRKKLISKIKKIVESKNFILSLWGIIILAFSINLVELACSLGFPVVFTEILSLNNITGVVRILYLLLYILFYMVDDIVVFSISMITVEATGITNKYNALCTLVSAIIMLMIGLLLLLRPEWLMLNF